MNNNETFIGKVKSVTGTTVSIELDENIRSTLPILDGVLYRIGQIGSFIRIPFGYIDLYGVVTQAGSDAIPEKLLENEKIVGGRWIKATLIGEKIGKKFERGIMQFPIADDEVHLVTRDDLEIIYGGIDENKSIIVGQVSASENLHAYIDIDKLINRHCAILGSTGSGKSNTVSILLESIAKRVDKDKKKLKSTRIFLIDPHGEYASILGEYSKVFKVNSKSTLGEEELIIPYWALSFQEFIKSFPGKLSEKQEEYIRDKVLQMKIDASKHLVPIPPEQSISADSPIPFSLNKLWFDLIDIEQKTFGDRKLITESRISTGNPNTLSANKYTIASTNNTPPFSNRAAQGILGFLNLMRNRILDQRYKFLYQLQSLEPDLDGKISGDLSSLIHGWIGKENPITILDLSGVPSEVMSSVSGSVISLIYEFLYWGQNLDVGGREDPILFVLEEAHTYLKSGADSISSRIVQKIAKEGRKYGAGLLLVTQRPSELDETVLSQCGSVIALRMTNGNDRGHVKTVVEDSLGELIDLLPGLRTGEGLIMGECVKLPMRAKFSQTKQPKNTDPLVSEKWKADLPELDNFKKTIEYWRSNEISI